MLIHALPENLSPCGGIKVHYELCEIEKDLGINSVIAFPDKNKIPKWFKRNVGEVLSYGEALDLGFKDKKNKKDVLVIGWEDPDMLNNSFPSFFHACYIQGDVFWKGEHNYFKKFIVCSNSYIRNKINVFNCPIINPYINTNVFYPNEVYNLNLPYKVLIQCRKNGKEALDKILSLVPKNYYKNKFEFTLLKDSSEKDFAKKLREHDVFFAHSYPEGFGLPSLEAMSSKTLVIGFSGGGGVEFLKNEENSFIVSDGDYVGIVQILEKLLTLSKTQIDLVISNAYKISLQYSKENTKTQLINFLRYANLHV